MGGEGCSPVIVEKYKTKLDLFSMVKAQVSVHQSLNRHVQKSRLNFNWPAHKQFWYWSKPTDNNLNESNERTVVPLRYPRYSGLVKNQPKYYLFLGIFLFRLVTSLSAKVLQIADLFFENRYLVPNWTLFCTLVLFCCV